MRPRSRGFASEKGPGNPRLDAIRTSVPVIALLERYFLDPLADQRDQAMSPEFSNRGCLHERTFAFPGLLLLTRATGLPLGMTCHLIKMPRSCLYKWSQCAEVRAIIIR